jgi:hypothetical protein
MREAGQRRYRVYDGHGKRIANERYALFLRRIKRAYNYPLRIGEADDIMDIKRNGNRIMVYTDKNEVLITGTLKSIEKRVAEIEGGTSHELKILRRRKK